MKRLFLAVSLALCVSTPAMPPTDCFFGLGMLSDDGDPAELAAGTYARLMEALGSRLSPASLRKVVESQDPFTVPDQDGLDLQTLRRNLAELKRLLEAKEWNRPEIRAAMLARVDTRGEALQEQSDKRDQTVREVWNDFRMDISSNPKPVHAISPDGRWIVMLDTPEDFFTRGGGQKMKILDRQTGKTTEYPSSPKVEGEDQRHGRLVFGGDGKHLNFFSMKNVITSVPMVDGVPQWDKAVNYDRGEVGGPFTMPGAGENPKYVFSGNKSKIQRVNLETGELVKIPLPGSIGDLDIKQVGSVGMSDSVYAVGTSGNMGRIVAIDFDANGKPLPAARLLAAWPKAGTLHGITWTPEGRPITLLGRAFYAWPTKEMGPPLAIVDGNVLPGATLGNPRHDVSVAMHPTGAAVLWTSNPREGLIEYVNFADPKQPVRAFPVGDSAEVVHFSPDGQMLVTKHWSQVHFINLKRRLDPP